jgi:hypothetical protein
VRLPDAEVRETIASILEAALRTAEDPSELLPFEWLPEGDVVVQMIQTKLTHPRDGRNVYAATITIVSSAEVGIEAICAKFRSLTGLE